MRRLCAIALILLSSACGASLERANTTPEPSASTPAPTRTSGAKVKADATAEPATTGKIVLTVVDTNKLHPAGIPLLIDGRPYVSDANGRVSFTAEAGRYSAKVITGCGPEINVHSGGSAQFGLIEGETITGELNVAWRHRYQPSGPAHASVVGDWPIGKKIDVIYAAIDDCTQERAQNKAFGSFSFHTSTNVELVGTPSLKTDEHGNAVVSVRCTGRGAIGLKLRDRDDPKATFPLDDHLADFGGTPQCG